MASLFGSLNVILRGDRVVLCFLDFMAHRVKVPTMAMLSSKTQVVMEVKVLNVGGAPLHKILLLVVLYLYSYYCEDQELSTIGMSLIRK